jgi:uncharacterized membrane protein YgaE (UPF0421/DUF939 family)
MPRLQRLPREKVRKNKPLKGIPLVAVPKKQSLLGRASVGFAVLSVFCIAVEWLLRMQPGVAASEYGWHLRQYLLPTQFFAALLGIACAAFSFGLSSRRQRDAVVGLILSLVVLTGWLVLRVYFK